jgi:hypothetical protein
MLELPRPKQGFAPDRVAAGDLFDLSQCFLALGALSHGYNHRAKSAKC